MCGQGHATWVRTPCVGEDTCVGQGPRLARSSCVGEGPVRVRALEFPLLKGLGGKQLPSPGNHRSLLPKGRGSSHTGSSRGLAQEPGRRARVSSPCLDSEERNVPLKSSSVGSGLNAEPSCPLRDLQGHSGPASQPRVHCSSRAGAPRGAPESAGSALGALLCAGRMPPPEVAATETRPAAGLRQGSSDTVFTKPSLFKECFAKKQLL